MPRLKWVRKKPYVPIAETRRKAKRRKKLAWLLRLRGLTFDQIGKRCGGVGRERARQLVAGYSRYLNGRMAACHTKWRFIEPP